MTDIAVIGPGAIGGTVAAWLMRNPGNAVTVCARSHFAKLNIDTPVGMLTATPKVLVEPDDAEVADWVLVATKAYDVAGAASWLRKLNGPETRVAVLQNGVEHIERFAAYATAIIPVVVDLPAERSAPGHVWQRRDGSLTVPDDSDGRDFARLFLTTGFTVVTTPDFRSLSWRKLALNCAGAVPALTLRPAGIALVEAIGDIMRDLVRECIAVGRAAGAILDDSLVEEVLDSYRNGPPDAINSLHADRLAGRPLEIDARNGAVVRIGRRHGVATPINQLIVALLETASGDLPRRDQAGVVSGGAEASGTAAAHYSR
jgi:2-dehydropantoate 2-reductase